MLSKFHIMLALCFHGSIALYVKNYRVLSSDGHMIIENAPKFTTFNHTKKEMESRRHSRFKRHARQVEIEIDGAKTSLDLTPLEHNVVLDELQEQIRIEGTYFKDMKNLAIMFAYYKNDEVPSIYYDGVFGESSATTVARSVQEKWLHESEIEINDYTINERVENVSDYMVSHDYIKDHDLLDEPLKTLYPKILVIVESKYFELFNKDVTECVKYLSIFWNAVNLRYSRFSNPRVRIIITGIIIEQDMYTLRYIYDSRKKSDLTKLDTQILLDKAGAYFSGDDFATDSRKFKNFDATFTISHFESGTVVGRAFVGTICSQRNNVAFIKDDGNFDGIQSAAHELGHLLGLPHDGEKDAHYCKHYYYKHNVGTVMAPVRESKERFIWSKCSRMILEKFSWRKAAGCLKYPERKNKMEH